MSKTIAKKLYCLTWLNSNLRQAGIHSKCMRYDLSNDKSKLSICYLDYLFNPQFIFVYRSSRLCYRIIYKNQTITARNSGIATKFLIEIFDEIIPVCDKYKILTVAELHELDKKHLYPGAEFNSIHHSKNYDLSQRLTEYNKARNISANLIIGKIDKKVKKLTSNPTDTPTKPQ